MTEICSNSTYCGLDFQTNLFLLRLCLVLTKVTVCNKLNRRDAPPAVPDNGG